MSVISISRGTASRPLLAVISTEVLPMSPNRVSIKWTLSSQPGEEWLAAFRHPSVSSTPARHGVTTSYGAPLALSDGVILWSIDAAEMGPAMSAGFAMIDRATAVIELLAG